MGTVATSGAQDPLTLTFLDPGLEERYQRTAGAESLNGFRMIALASGVIWALLAFVLPVATTLPAAVAGPIAQGMALLGFVVAAFSAWATTINRQHALSSSLTTANSIVILIIGSIGDVLPGYAVAAIMLLFIWGFVSRTRFVYAAMRTIIVAIAFAIAIYLYPATPILLVDVLFFIAGAIGTLLALRILERNRRQLFAQDLLIRQQSEELAIEAGKSEQLILNILPATIAARLRNGESTIADDYPSVTVLFGDIVGFTPTSARLTAHELIDLLSGLFSSFDDLVAEAGLEKIKTIGDNYMAVGGLFGDEDHASRIVRLGLAMLEEARRHEALGKPLELRIGVNSGPVSGGVIGTRKLAFDLWGDTVNVASRLQEVGPPGQIHLSEQTWLLVRDEFECEALGESELRGHASVKTYRVVAPIDHHAGGSPTRPITAGANPAS